MSHRIFAMKFSSIHTAYVNKAEKKGRTRAEVDLTICWLTGHDEISLAHELERGTDVQTFFARAPALNPKRELVTGVVCGVRVEAVEDPLMRLIRILDKLVDELAKGRPMEKILRS